MEHLKRTIYCIGDVCSSMALEVIQAIEELDASDGGIRIVLNSPGGSEEDGYAIYDVIMQCRNHVTIDGYGSVQSIAAAIFQAGDTRRLAPNASFMIHHGIIGNLGGQDQEMKQDEVIELAEQLQKDNQKYYNILSSASRQSDVVIAEWCRAETFFTPEEAVESGFADEVIVPLKVKTNKKRRKKK